MYFLEYHNELAAILFLVVLNSINDNVLVSYLGSYADDTKVLHSIHSPEDAKTLQQDLDAIYNWAEQNNMQFNGSKFELLRYGQNSELKDKTGYVASNG